MPSQRQIELYESWIPVVGFEGLYEVSFFGRIRNVKTGRILVPRVRKDGYHALILCRDNTQKSLLVHRIVAAAWIANLDNEPCVDHIDHNRGNNAFYNLRWVSASDNSRNQSLSSLNTSGSQGVSNVHINGYSYWVATWCDNEGRHKYKYYSTAKFNNAKQLAIGWRDQMVAQYYNRVQ